MVKKIGYSLGLLAALSVLATTPAFAADALDTTLTHVTDWLQSKAILIVVLMLVIGGFVMMIKFELGKRIVMGAIVGLLLILFARPLVLIAVQLGHQLGALVHA